MPWKLGLVVFVAAALVMTLGPILMYVVGTIVALGIVGLLVALTLLGLFGRRERSGPQPEREIPAAGTGDGAAGPAGRPAGAARDDLPSR